MYFRRWLQLNSFVEKKAFVNYTPIEIAFSIAFTRELYEFSNDMNLLLLCEMFSISARSYDDYYSLFKSKIRVQKCRSNAHSGDREGQHQHQHQLN